MGPITWRNVDAPSLGNPSASLNSAAQLFQNAFGGLKESLKEYETTDRNNFVQGRNNNTNALMLELAQIQTPEQGAAAVPDILRRVQELGASVDTGAVASRAQATMPQLYDTVNKKLAFDDGQQAVKDRPIQTQFAALMAKGDLAGATALFEANQTGLGAQTSNAMATQLLSRRDYEKTDERARIDQSLRIAGAARESVKLDSSLRTDDAQIKLMQAQSENLRAKAGAGPKGPTPAALKLFLDTTVAPITDAVDKSVFSGAFAVNDKKAIANELKSPGVGVHFWNWATNPDNFVDRVTEKLKSSKNITADGQHLVLKVGGEVETIPLSSKLLLSAIRDDNGTITDPSPTDVAKKLVGLLEDKSMRDNWVKYGRDKLKAKTAQDFVSRAALGALTSGEDDSKN